jgi:heme-degrading monooxygenase HmoA
MIARIWRGVVRLDDADAYADYIRETGFSAYAATDGNRGAWMLRRDTGERSEFVTFSLWESAEAIRAFAGDDIDTAVYYPEDERYLVERDAKVTHYEVADQVNPPAGP